MKTTNFQIIPTIYRDQQLHFYAPQQSFKETKLPITYLFVG